MYNKVIMFKVKYEILKAGKVVAKFGNFKSAEKFNLQLNEQGWGTFVFARIRKG